MRYRIVQNILYTACVLVLVGIFRGFVYCNEYDKGIHMAIAKNNADRPNTVPFKLSQSMSIERELNYHRNKEITANEFIRLLVMRLIYGLAVTMGIEDRIEGLFNGAFVPPNADNDYDFALGGFSDYDDNGRDYTNNDFIDMNI